MKILNGQKIASRITGELKKKLKNKKIKPKLAVILVGNNQSSKLYVELKEKKAREIGLDFTKYFFPASTTEKEILALIKQLNRDNLVSGILVQLPLPAFLDAEKIIGAIKPQKDVDGFGPHNRKSILESKKPFLSPVLPQALLEILQAAKVSLKNQRVAAVVNSEIFGQVLKKFFAAQGARCEFLVKKVCLDKGLENFLGQADIAISVTGCPRLINGYMLKKGAVLIDAGIFQEGRKIVGDVDLNSVGDKVAAVTPTPGGVGPVTVAVLLRNVFLAAKKSITKIK